MDTMANTQSLITACCAGCGTLLTSRPGLALSDIRPNARIHVCADCLIDELNLMTTFWDGAGTTTNPKTWEFVTWHVIR